MEGKSEIGSGLGNGVRGFAEMGTSTGEDGCCETCWRRGRLFEEQAFR